jgi:hypothetical protein
VRTSARYAHEPLIVGGEIKVTTDIMRDRMNVAILSGVKQEELRFRSNIEFPATLLDDFQLAAQRTTRISFKGVPSGL